jgi:hypothetical protein
MKFEISSYYQEVCEQFAEDQLSTSKDLYSYRGESRLDKMKDDIITGKMAELAARKFLLELGYSCPKPDFSIYERQNKSYEPDLTTECGLRIHVKSQGLVSYKRYGASWLLQKNDRLTRDPDKKDILIMVLVDEAECEILGSCKVLNLVDHLEEPRVPSYRHTKRALYLTTLKDRGVNLRAIRRKK